MNFSKGIFTLLVKEGVTITPGQIRKVVRERFKIPRVELAGLFGEVSERDGKVVFTPRGQKVHYTLANAKGKSLVKGLEPGERFRLSGESKEIARAKKKDKYDKKKSRPALQLVVEKVEQAKKISS